MPSQRVVLLAVTVFLTAIFGTAINSRAQQADGTQIEYQTDAGLKYLVYVPPGYNANTSSQYPLLIYLHGGGDINDAYDISQLTNPTPHHAPPWLIAHGQWSSSYPFIVVSPLLKRDTEEENFNNQLWPMDIVDGLVEKIKTDFHVNPAKIYFTGMSLGAAGCWTYAATYPAKVAGLLVFSGNTDTETASTVADIPIWAFHGMEDGFVPTTKTTDMIEAINDYSGHYKAHVNLLFSVGHYGWNEVYNGKMGYKVFDWLLQFTKGDLTNKPPFVFAGGDEKIMMRTGSLYLAGEYFDPEDGEVTSVKWSQTSGPTLTLTNDDQKLLKLTNLSPGTFTFQLRVTDKDGLSSTASMQLQILSSTTNMTVTDIQLTNGTGQVISTLHDDMVINKATIGATQFKFKVVPSGTANSSEFHVSAEQLTPFDTGAPYSGNLFGSNNALLIPYLGDYNICASAYPGWNGDEGTPGIRQCFKVTFINQQEQQISNFYPKAGMDISLLGSWTANSNGTGASPTSFSGDFQNFNIDKSVLLNGNLTVSGNQSNLYVKAGGALTINANATLTAVVNMEGNAVVNVNTATPVTFGTIPATSTINFDQNVTTIPQLSYGNLSVSGAGSTKTLVSGSTIVAGTLTIADDVVLNGNADNTSMISLGGDLVINENNEFNPATRFGLQLTGTSQLLTVLSGKVYLGQLTVGAAAELRTSGAVTTLEIGSSAGQGGLVISNGGTLNLNNHNLVLSQNSALNNGGQTGTLAMNGGTLSFISTSGLASNLYMASNANTVQSLLIAQSNGAEVNVLGPVLITDFVKAKNGTIHSNGNLSLVSTENQTARIDPVEGTGAIEGAVEFQRFVSGSNLYRYISFPVSAVKVSDLQNYIPVNGHFAGASASNMAASLYSYNNQTGGWSQFPVSSNAETFQVGSGYSLLLPAASTQPVKVKGLISQGDFTFSLPPVDGEGNGGGWNLIGNPYACPIQWGGSGWSALSDINVTAYVRANTSSGQGRFLVWDGSTGDEEEFGGAVAQGQSVWIKVTGPSPVLTITESAKISSSTTKLWREKTDSTPSNKMVIELTSDDLVDRTYLKLNTLASDKFDKNLDGVKRLNDYFNISSESADSVSLAINNISDTTCVKTVKLVVQTKTAGTYSLNFSGSLLDKNVREIVLIDRYLQSKTVLKQSGKYNFNVTTDPKSSDINRFRIALNTSSSKPQITAKGNTLTSNFESGNQWYYNNERIENATGSSYEVTKPGNYQVRVSDGGCGIISDNITMAVTGVEYVPAEGITIYPNPAKNTFHIRGYSQGEGVQFSIVTVYGTSIQEGTLSANDFESGKDIVLSENIPSGIYFIRLQSQHLNYTTKLSIE